MRALHGRYAAMWLWIAVPLALYGLYPFIGSPHLIWSYEFRANGDRWNPYADRYYTRCTYVGWNAQTVTVGARDGKCAWVRFFRLEDR